MRQVSHESNCVSQQQSLPGRKLNAPSGGIQSRKEFVFDEYLSSGQFFQQSRFTGVGITDDCAIRKRQTHPLLSLSCPSGANEFQIFFQTINPASNKPAVCLKLSFAFPLSAQATCLSIKVTPGPR